MSSGQMEPIESTYDSGQTPPIQLHTMSQFSDSYEEKAHVPNQNTHVYTQPSLYAAYMQPVGNSLSGTTAQTDVSIVSSTSQTPPGTLLQQYSQFGNNSQTFSVVSSRSSSSVYPPSHIASQTSLSSPHTSYSSYPSSHASSSSWVRENVSFQNNQLILSQNSDAVSFHEANSPFIRQGPISNPVPSSDTTPVPKSINDFPEEIRGPLIEQSICLLHRDMFLYDDPFLQRFGGRGISAAANVIFEAMHSSQLFNNTAQEDYLAINNKNIIKFVYIYIFSSNYRLINIDNQVYDQREIFFVTGLETTRYHIYFEITQNNTSGESDNVKARVKELAECFKTGNKIVSFCNVLHHIVNELMRVEDYYNKGTD